tara:strand:+ start:2999 stop:3100 length:102 start_codon:yes stop_codon:yes gene_type:complete
MELLDFGSSREKAESIGMLRVLKDLEIYIYDSK